MKIYGKNKIKGETNVYANKPKKNTIFCLYTLIHM